MGNYSKVTWIFNETPGPLSFVGEIDYPYPPYEQIGDYVSANGTEITIEQEVSQGGLAFDLGATPTNASVNPLPETWRLKKIIVCR